MNLYEIDARLKALEELGVDIETGEIIQTEDEFNKLFDEIQLDLNTKIENTVCFIKNLQSDVDAIKIEQQKLMQRRKQKENLIERLKNRINDYITLQYTNEDGIVDNKGLNKYKLESPRMKLTYRKSEKVVVNDVSLIPNEFIKEHKLTEDDVKKSDIKTLLKQGNTINGVELLESVNMQIK